MCKYLVFTGSSENAYIFKEFNWYIIIYRFRNTASVETDLCAITSTVQMAFNLLT